MSRLELIKNNLLPPLLPTFYKGQLGKLAVIGGCEDYTGAPYFSAHASMLSGVDLVHIICEKSAAQVIKTYSPDLMVHPYLLDSNNLNSKLNFINSVNNNNNNTNNNNNNSNQIIDNQMEKIINLIDKMDVIIIGPGFGRNDPIMNEFLILILKFILTKSTNKDNIPIILDADALFHLSNNSKIQDLVKNSANPNIILTPNLIEFKRLCDGFKIDYNLINLSNFLKCTIIEKGQIDKISYHGNSIIECNLPGSLKRVGGQGDSLTGMIGAFLCWGMSAYKKGIYKTSNNLSNEEIISLSCLAGCITTRKASHLAFQKYGRSMLTSNLHEFINKAFTDI